MEAETTYIQTEREEKREIRRKKLMKIRQKME